MDSSSKRPLAALLLFAMVVPLLALWMPDLQAPELETGLEPLGSQVTQTVAAKQELPLQRIPPQEGTASVEEPSARTVAIEEVGDTVGEYESPEGYPYVLFGSVHWPDGTLAKTMIPDSPPMLESAHLFKLLSGESDEGPRDLIIWVTRPGHFGVAAKTPEKVRVLFHASRSKPAGSGGNLSSKRIGYALEEELDLLIKNPRITLQPGGEASGRVLDEARNPVHKFTVTAYTSRSVWESGLPTIEREFESADGSFVLGGLGPCDYYVFAQRAGGAPSQTISTKVKWRTGLVLTSPKEARMGGVVVDATGQPVAHATAWITVSESEESADSLQEFTSRKRTVVQPGKTVVLSDKVGEFEFGGLGAYEVTLQVEAEGYAPITLHGLKLKLGETLPKLRIELIRAAEVTGELHPGIAAEALRSVSIRVEPSGHVTAVMPDKNGRFFFGNLPEGEALISTERFPWSMDQIDFAQGPDEVNRSLEVLRSRSEGVEAKVSLTPGQTTHVVLGKYFEPDIRVFGYISEGGAPTRDLMLGIRPWQAGEELAPSAKGRSSRSGTYEISVGGAGFYELVALDDWRKQVLARFELKKDQSDQEINLKLPSGKISGQVTGPNGPLPNTYIRIWGRCPELRGEFYRQMACDKEGRFVAQRLPRGSFMIGAWQVIAQESPKDLAYTFTDWIDLRAEGEVQNIHLELRLGGIIEGIVRDKQGAPFKGASIWVRDLAEANLSAPLETDAYGKFTTGLIRPGPVLVFGFHEGKYTNLVRTEMKPAGRLQVELKFK